MTYIPPGSVPETSTISDLLVIRFPFAAGGGGSADDVSIFTANIPFGFRILDSYFYISSGVALATIQLRSATGGGGSALTDTIAAGATGRLGNTLKNTTDTLSSGASLVIRRSDSALAGEVIIHIIKT